MSNVTSVYQALALAKVSIKALALALAAKAFDLKKLFSKNDVHFFLKINIYLKNDYNRKSKSSCRIRKLSPLRDLWLELDLKKNFFRKWYIIFGIIIQKLPPFVSSFPTSADDEWKFEFWPLHFEYREY